MFRIPTFVICVSMWMGTFVSGTAYCDPNPYVEYSCFSSLEIEMYLHDERGPSLCEQNKNCCWNASIPRCYAKSTMSVQPQSLLSHSSYLQQSNPYSQPQPPVPQSNQNRQQPHGTQTSSQHGYQNQYRNSYNAPSHTQTHYPYQSQNQQSNYPRPTTNQNRNRYPYTQKFVKPSNHNRRQPTYYQQKQPNPLPYRQQYSNQQQQGQTSPNLNNLLAALGRPTQSPRPGTQNRQGAMGTNVAAVSKQLSTSADSALASIDQCSLANSIESEAARQQFQSLFSCTGNEPKIPPGQAEALLSGVIGNSQGGATIPVVGPKPPSGTPAPKVSPQLTFPVLAPANAVGSRLPTYGVQNYRPPPTNARACLLLKSVTSEIGAIMKLRYRCGATGNPLIDLATGNSPKGLGSIPDIISLFGFTKDAPVVTTVSAGSINPNLIPSDILSKCITNRYTYESCRSGYNTNINTESECFNVGCLFFRDSYGTRCFKCTLVPASAYRLQDSADTCSVDTREDCEGFKTFQYTVVALDVKGKPDPLRPAPAVTNPLASLFSGNPALNALIQSNPSLLGSLGSNPALLSLLRSGQARSLGTNHANTRQLDTSTLLSLLSGGTSSASSPNSLLLNMLTGGRGSTSGRTNLLLNALTGKSTTGFSLPKLSAEALTNLKSTCETKGCCWAGDAASQLGGTCFKKGVAFPSNCLPTAGSGTCGKSLDTSNLQRVVGGVAISSTTSRPWMAMIQQVTNGVAKFRCGGVQICSQWILTTASCLQRKDDLTNSYLRVPNINPATIRVFVGTLTPAVPGPEVGVEKIILHPGYTTLQSYNDIALIQIRSLAFGASNSPVCLPPLKTAVPASGQVLYFTGYGKNSANGLADFTTLKELPFTVQAASDCNTAYPGTVLPQSGIFCATSSSDTDTCYGDGGSPVVKYDSVTNTFTLYGINFAGSDRCDGTKPALFTSITNFMAWIAQSTNGCCSVPGSRYNV